MAWSRKSEKCRDVLMVYGVTADETAKPWTSVFRKLNLYKCTSYKVTPTQIYAEMSQLASGWGD